MRNFDREAIIKCNIKRVLVTYWQLNIHPSQSENDTHNIVRNDRSVNLSSRKIWSEVPFCVSGLLFPTTDTEYLEVNHQIKHLIETKDSCFLKQIADRRAT